MDKIKQMLPKSTSFLVLGDSDRYSERIVLYCTQASTGNKCLIFEMIYVFFISNLDQAIILKVS